MEKMLTGVFWGAIWILLGGVLLLVNYGVLPQIVKLWPILIVLVGIKCLAKK